MIIGFSLAKLVNRNDYPIDINILQHRNLFDMHYFGVPKKDQDEDGTAQSIIDAGEKYNQNIKIVELDWPDKNVWTEESLDAKLQTQLIQHIEQSFTDKDWVIKIDLDELYHEKDFAYIQECIETCNRIGIDNITHGYYQFFGSLRNRVKDPTQVVSHIFKNGSFHSWGGNDAMIIRTQNGIPYPMPTVKLHHIGYCRSAEKLTEKLHEHIRLNKSVYPDIKLENYQWTWPSNVPGAYLWPQGIAVLRGAKNEVEYIPHDIETLPFTLKDNLERFDFHLP